MTPIRFLIADDHEVVRRGVRAVLERQAGWVVCAEARTGREAVAKAIDFRPNVIVLDISMPELNGLEAARQIRGVVPAKILMLTVHEVDHLVTEVLDAGVHGYVLKADAGHSLVAAVEAVLAGKEFFTARVDTVATLHRATRSHAVAARKSRAVLTPREREVVQLLAEARSNKEIGNTLGITTKTAETHRAHIMAKLQLHSVSELVRYAIRNGIIEP